MFEKGIYGHIRLLVHLNVKGLEKRVLILTGSPGIGKTTVLDKTVWELKMRGINVGGIMSREVRENGTRIGFQISDIANGKTGWLAQTNQKNGPQVGRYWVNLGDLDAVGAQAIINATETADVVAIDEIGPMELFSEKFKNAAKKALESGKLVIAVVHFKASDPVVVQAKAREDSEVFVVTEEDRERLPAVLVERAAAFLKRK